MDKERGVVVRTTGDHTHDSDLLKKAVKTQELNSIRNAASNPTVSTRTVLGNLANQIEAEVPGGINHLSKAPTFKKAVQRERQKAMGFPPKPKDWKDVILPTHLKTTMDNNNFLILDEEMDSVTNKKILGFASPTGIDLLQSKV